MKKTYHIPLKDKIIGLVAMFLIANVIMFAMIKTAELLIWIS